MDQASGGEDPNKPSKKKSNDDEGRNKKLVCMHSDSRRSHVNCVPSSVTLGNPTSKGHISSHARGSCLNSKVVGSLSPYDFNLGVTRLY